VCIGLRRESDSFAVLLNSSSHGFIQPFVSEYETLRGDHRGAKRRAAEGLGGVSSSPGMGVTPGKILKFET